MKNATVSNIRIPLYNKKGVEIHLCASNGRFSLDITNSSGLPRLVALANAMSSSDSPTVIQMGANCLRKLPWANTDVSKLRNMEVKVSESVEESLDMNKGFD